MAICRCERHNVGEAKHNYRAFALPLGYPETGVICGRAGCEEPARVWLNDSEREEYQKGTRVFRVPTYAVKVKVSDELTTK
jgi:hypothetical protein